MVCRQQARLFKHVASKNTRSMKIIKTEATQCEVLIATTCRMVETNSQLVSHEDNWQHCHSVLLFQYAKLPWKQMQSDVQGYKCDSCQS